MRPLEVDPVELTAALVRRPSVTPDDAGCLDLLEAALRPLGFTVERPRFEAPGTVPVDNLVATLGGGAPHLAFNGHVDVVPPGDPARWTGGDPFSGAVRDGRLYGRGAADMKSGVAAFVAAASRHVAAHGPPPGGFTLLITADEEGPSVNGTAPMMAWAEARGLRFDGCLVGEPTCATVLGDAAKIGRRGAANGTLRALGRQGHTAYPERADNAAHALVRMLHAITSEPIDGGSAWFQPTGLQVASIDVGNPASNVIPGEARALLDVRYGDLQTAASVEAWLRERLDAAGGPYELAMRSSGDAFRTEPGPLTATLAAAVERVTGRRPGFNTGGGTSDARFVRRHCPVVEFGILGPTLHQADEHVAVDDIRGLAAIYATFLELWYAAP